MAPSPNDYIVRILGPALMAMGGIGIAISEFLYRKILNEVTYVKKNINLTPEYANQNDFEG
jgi:hypothetical protein